MAVHHIAISSKNIHQKTHTHK